MKKSAIIIIFWLTVISGARAGWTPAVRISDQAPSYEPRITADGETLHVVYWRGGAFTSSYYLRSTNGGESWSVPFHLADTNYTSNNVMPVIRANNDRVAAIWRGDIRGSGNELNYGYRLSTNSGATWDQIEYILPIDQEMLQKHTFEISDTNILFLYSYWDEEIIVESRASTDWGNSWTMPTEVFRAQETGEFEMVARGDTVHLVWVGRFNQGDRWETYYCKSENGGQDWTGNLMLSTPDDRGSDWPSIAINEDGGIVICWMDYKYSPNLWRGDLFVRYSFDGGDNWTDEEQITFTHDALYPHVIWRGDSIHVAWEDWRYGQGDIFYMLSENNGLTWGEQQRVEDDPGISLAPDLAVSGAKVHVVWRQDSGLDGPGIYYSRWENESAIDDKEENYLPDDYSLRAYPNPFNSHTIITYKNLEGGEIEIYNINGQKIRTFESTQIKEGQIEWDARDALGNKVSSGIYFARAGGGGNSNTIKLLYIK